MNKSLEGYRTLITSGVVTVLGVLAKVFNVEIPPEYATEIVSAVMVGSGVLFTGMRLITKKPYGEG